MVGPMEKLRYFGACLHAGQDSQHSDFNWRFPIWMVRSWPV